MPYAADNHISRKQFENSVEITEEQYQEARKHLLDRSGKPNLVRVHDGEMILTQKPDKLDGHKEPVWQDGEWVHEPIPEPESVEDESGE